MFESLSDNRAAISAVLIILCLVMFLASIYVGRKQSVLTGKDEIFGDPERTRGGWCWTMCGIVTMILFWF